MISASTARAASDLILVEKAVREVIERQRTRPGGWPNVVRMPVPLSYEAQLELRRLGYAVNGGEVRW